MALEYLFTGRCELTDAAGRGAEALIRAGEKELEVSATLESSETICRRRTPRSHMVELNRKRVPVDAAEASLEKRVGLADVLSAVLNADRFIEMAEAEENRVLAQVVDAGKVLSQRVKFLSPADGTKPDQVLAPQQRSSRQSLPTDVRI